MKNQVLTRQHRRADLDLYVNKIVGDEPHMVRVRDISESGMFLYRLLEPELDANGFVGLEIKLPETDDVIWAVGEVVRTAVRDASPGVAVRFVRIAEADRALIANYVADAMKLAA